MVQLLTIIAFVSLHVRDAIWAQPGVVPPPDPGWSGPFYHASSLATALLVAGTLGACALAGHIACLLAGRRIDKTGNILSVSGVERSLLAVRVLATLLFVASLFVLDWLGVVRAWMGDLIVLDEFVCLLPLFALFLASWSSAYPIERRLRDATLLRRLDSGLPVEPGPTRGQSVLAHARMSLAIIAIPVLMISAWSEIIQRFHTHTGLEPAAEVWTLDSIRLVGTIAVFLLAPAILKAVWSTSPLGEGEIRDMLLRVARKHKVTMREPLVWHTHGSMMNGAVLGLLFPFRYLLFTDLLLERLLPRQVEAVAAHEFAHIRNKHILWLAVSTLGTVLSLSLVLTLLAHWINLPDTLGIDFVLEGLPLIAAATVFGWISRRFEWQADASAVRHLSEELSSQAAPDGEIAPTPRPNTIVPAAAAWMESALRDVARLNAIDPSRFAFRHGSIDDRIRRLRQIIGLSTSMLPIDNTVRWIKVTSLLVFLLAIGGLVLEAVTSN